MRVSISVTNFSWPGGPHQLAGHLRALVEAADAGGVDTVWVADHLLQMDPNAGIDEPMLEAYTLLGHLAAVTERVGVGAMVTWASLRPATLLVKAVTTLDVLSGGRAWFGIGAGYQGDEASMMGLPFPPTRQRFDEMEEILQLAAQMWSGDETPFMGDHVRVERPVNEPAPVHRPRVLIGGSGEKRTLPLVARYADACNFFDIPDGGATLRRKQEVLAAACEAIGRDRAEIETTLSTRLAPDETGDAFASRCEQLEIEHAIDHVVLAGNGPWTVEALAPVTDAIRVLS